MTKIITPQLFINDTKTPDSEITRIMPTSMKNVVVVSAKELTDQL